uniref:39S ribosomal protein L9, mitochondrial isoform X2 n=1 Tax=Callithrix jacchus TaxID=9483 RepID=UPI00159EA5EE|nr:39S ribosomal protein L9, mitochondrial isoform X2 [Callithrix jacchus]
MKGTPLAWSATSASLKIGTRSSWSAGGRYRWPGRAGSRACTGDTESISWWRTLSIVPKKTWSSSSRSPWRVRPGPRRFLSSWSDLGVRGDLVSVKKYFGRNRLLPQGLAVYASPENKQLFEEEKSLRQEGKLEKIQTKAGEATVKFLKSCHLEVGMKNNVKWELNPEIVARHFFKNLGVVVAPHTLKLPEEPITRWGEYWCEVTVNGLDTVRVPMSVVNFERPKTKRYKYWLAQQAAKGMTPTGPQKI